RDVASRLGVTAFGVRPRHGGMRRGGWSALRTAFGSTAGRLRRVANALALAVYLALIAAGAAAVWRRPAWSLYAFVVGLALHNSVLAALYSAGVRGGALTGPRAREAVRRR